MALPRTPREMALVRSNPHAHSVVMSYLGIRRSLGLLALMLPLILGPFGYFVLGIEVQDNQWRRLLFDFGYLFTLPFPERPLWPAFRDSQRAA